MNLFIKKSKNKAKARLLNCIEKDRKNILGISFDKMCREIEGVITKYFDTIDGFRLNIEKQERENTYTITLKNLKYKVR